MSIIEERINPLEIDRPAEVIEQIGAGLILAPYPDSFPHRYLSIKTESEKNITHLGDVMIFLISSNMENLDNFVADRLRESPSI
jgi:hypothetical protein